MTTRKKAPFDQSGSSLDSFLQEEGILEEVEAAAIERVDDWKSALALSASKVGKKATPEH